MAKNRAGNTFWVLEKRRRYVVDFSIEENLRLAEIGDAHMVFDALEAAADAVREEGINAEMLMRLPSGRALQAAVTGSAWK